MSKQQEMVVRQEARAKLAAIMQLPGEIRIHRLRRGPHFAHLQVFDGEENITETVALACGYGYLETSKALGIGGSPDPANSVMDQIIDVTNEQQKGNPAAILVHPVKA